jgi:3-oxoacyl-[acyl-carrier protein] reductase
MLLKGKHALITGASRGIGQSIARIFVEQGASVVLMSRSTVVQEVAQLLSPIAAQHGARVLAFQGDVCVDADVKNLIKLVRKEFGHLEVLVNNAGIMQQGLLGMTSLESMRAMLEVNVTAMMNLTQYAVRLSAADHPLSVINLASIAGTQGIEGISAYCASKGAVVSYTYAAAKELAARGIRVNAIAPGFIDTDMTRQLSPDWFEKRIENIRLGRIGKPEDIANAALFLASDLSSYVTGQVIGVDGGMIA